MTGSSAVVVALCVTIAATACQSSPARHAAPSPTVARGEPALTVVESGLRHPTAIPWQRARLVDAQTVDVYYTGSASACTALGNVRVAESATSVTVTLFVGVPPDVEDDVCTLVGVDARTRVRLREPLGGRTVVDGGATPPATRAVERA